MVSVVDVVGLLVLLGVNSAAAALMTRFFRVRLATQWGSILYVALLTPVVLTVTTILLGGFLSLGPDLGSRNAVLGIVIFLPIAMGVSFDFFWMPSPEEVDLPEKGGRQRTRREL
jgi:hypothetical protein